MASYWGPFVDNLFVHSNTVGFGWRKNRYRQKAPYVLNLPYTAERHDMKLIPNPWYTDYGRRATSPVTSSEPAAHNQAYAKFVDEAKRTSASLGASLGERKQAIDMMASRAYQMFNFARHLKSGRFRMALEDLGLQVTKDSNSKRHWRAKVRDKQNNTYNVKMRKGAKAFGNNFLEVHFGWEPLVKDIWSTTVITCNPIKEDASWSVEGKGSVVNNWNFIPPSAGSFTGINTARDINELVWSKEHILADVRVENPNEFLLSQLGLLNPAAIVWELVPFSFVADWLTSIGQVLQAETDFNGLALTNVQTTIHTKTVRRRWFYGYANLVSPPTLIAECWRLNCIYTKRILTFTGPTIAMKQVKLPSLTRGLTAVSLLTQMLR